MPIYNLKLKGYVGGYDFDPDYVDYILDKRSGQPVDVLIDSLGGSVAVAFSIVSAFKNHGNVNVHFRGMNASAATISSLGAKHITMDASAMYLVHKCSTFILKWENCNADQLQSLIDECKKQKKDLEKIDLNIASMYAAKCKKEKKCLLDLMTAGGWLTAKEALDWGFIDEITNLEDDTAPVLNDSVMASMISAGIPIPSVYKEKDKESAIAKFLSGLSSLFAPNSHKIVNTMQKKFTHICKALKIDSLEESDGKFSLTDVQLQSIEDAIENCSKQNDVLKNDMAVKDQTIADLKKKPADTTSIVVDTKKEEKPEDDYLKAVKNASDMFNSIP